ncbi:ribonuclease E [Flavimobilis soli]|uniref:Ribonuclease E n=1 Tax=Flavimobilis soli TaxID=442709 RepID=A0A2A9EHT0_9MICO|nr:ribonuclease E/G [Flavimobilis soli]PFG37802.1 ribonuclease E [Flavimobilis soli]
MNLDNSTTNAEGSAEPVKKTRRRVVRSAGTPTPVQSEAVAPVSVPASAASEPTDAPQEKAPRTRKARPKTESPAVESPAAETPAAEEKPAPKRRTRATRATAPAATAEAAPEAATVAAPTPAADAEAPAPKKSTRSRRATKPAAEPAETKSEAPAADETVADDRAAEDKSTEKAAPRRRSGRAKAAPAEAPEAPAAETATEEQAEKPARRSRRATKPSAVEAPTETTAPVEAVEAAAEEGEQAPVVETRLPMTALLFQAPDPTKGRARRRRVSAPAGPPEAIVPVPVEEADDETEEVVDAAAEVEAPEDVETPEAQDDATPQDETEDDEPSDEQESGSASGQRRRRRRGGRGRRRSSAQNGDQAEGDTDAEASDETDATEVEQDDEGDTEKTSGRSRNRSRRGSGRSAEASDAESESDDEAQDQDEDTSDEAGEDSEGTGSSSRRRRRRRRTAGSREGEPASTSTATRARRGTGADEVTALKGSTRLEAKRQRRREGRDAGRRRQIITEAEFLARRESVERSMVVRERDGRTQIAVLEDGVLVEHYVSQQEQASMAGNVYLGRVQNVLPSMEAAFIDVGKGRNAVLYAGEVNWDAAGLEGQPRRIEQALKSGDSVLVQVTKDPIGHKGARLTSQITLAGRYLVYVPGGGMTGISRKLPDTERARLKKILKEIVPDHAGVIVRTAAEGASEEELRADVARLQDQWAKIEKKSKTASAPALLQGEPDLAIRVVRDIFNDDFSSLVVQGDSAWDEISSYVGELAPDLAERVTRWTGEKDVFASHRIDEQLAKGMDRKVWLPSGGSLVIDRTEAMTVVDVNTGKFTGSGGTLEETVTRNNLEAAEEIVRQLRLRDIGGIIVIDFIDMVLESNRDLVLRRLVECLGRDRTKHQVAEVTSLGLVQMTRKRVGQGLVEAFSTTCEHCNGRGFIVHAEPIEKGNGGQNGGGQDRPEGESKRSRRKRGGGDKDESSSSAPAVPVLPKEEARKAVKETLATIAAAAAHAHEHEHDHAVEKPAAEKVAVEAAPALQADAEPAPVAEDAVEPAAEPVVAEPVAAEPKRRRRAATRPAAPAVEVEAPASESAEASSEAPVLDVLAELASVRRVHAPEVPAAPSSDTITSVDDIAVPAGPSEPSTTAPKRRRASSRGRSTRAAGAPSNSPDEG